MVTMGRTTGLLAILLAVLVAVVGCEKLGSIKGDTAKSTQKVMAKGSVNQSTPSVATKTRKFFSPMGANVLARVGKWSITAEEFDRRLTALKEAVPEYDTTNPQARRLVLDELVNQQVIVIGAEQSGLASHEDIKAAVDEFRRTLIVREVARQLTDGIAFTDEEARKFYEDNKAALIGPGRWHVREIVVPTKEQANDILGEILTGADFANMARLHSTGQTSAEGGDLGFITEEPFPQMGNALLLLEEGDVSGVFGGPEGYYIAKLEEKKGGEQIPFEDIKNDIIQSQTLLRQQQIILNHIDQLKAETPVEINEGLL